jgi:hypothetical protein
MHDDRPPSCSWNRLCRWCEPATPPVTFRPPRAAVMFFVIEQGFLHFRDSLGVIAVAPLFARNFGPCVRWTLGLERALTTVCHLLGLYLDEVALFSLAAPRLSLVRAFFGTRLLLGRGALRGAHGVPPGFMWYSPLHANLIAAGCMWAYAELFALDLPSGTFLFFFFVLAATPEDREILLRARGWFGDVYWNLLPTQARARLSTPRRLDSLCPTSSPALVIIDP